jgi:hypothetical protein
MYGKQPVREMTILVVSAKNEILIQKQNMKFKQGGTYLMLGLTEMEDFIVLADEDGRVFKLHYSSYNNEFESHSYLL